MDSSQFKSEEVTVLVGKQNKYGEEVVERKKKGKKGKRNKKKDAHTNKVQIDIGQIQQFDKLKVLPPTSLQMVDETIRQINEKKEYFLQKREEL